MKLVFVFFVVSVVAAGSGNVINENGSRILGGTTASITDYPYAVSMLNELFGTYYLSANGVILTSNSILSAAQPYVNFDGSFQPSSRWTARVGSALFATGGTMHAIQDITLHPNFNATEDVINDLAVLRTTTSISFTPAIQQAILAHIDFGLLNEQAVTAVGWGLHRIGEVQMFPQLLANGLRYNTPSVCSTLFGETVTREVICVVATINGAGPCTGSAGSPLVMSNVVLGIFSYNRECGNMEEPNIYVNIVPHIQWISDVATAPLETASSLVWDMS